MRGLCCHRLSFFVLASLAATASAAVKVDRVVLIVRHGERTRLEKHATTLEEQAHSGPQLTAAGTASMRRLGTELRARYNSLDLGCAGPTGTAADTCVHSTQFQSTVAAISSGLDRTLQSATAALDGFFSEQQSAPVPIYSRPDDSDVVLRGYTKCPALSSAISAFWTSPAALQKEADTAALRESVRWALKFPTGTQLGLAKVWDAFDAANVAAHSGTPILGTDTLAQLTELAGWVEASKFGPGVAGSSCGGSLLRSALEVLEEGPNSSPRPGASLVYYSAHYPTVLCLASALLQATGTASFPSNWPAGLAGRRQLMAYGAVLAFEAGADDGVGSTFSRPVRLVYKDDWY
eukprot:g4580.t1